jgi:hypothetical protein
MTFEEWRKSRLTMDGYAQYTAEDAWEAGRRAALEEAVRVTALSMTTSHACDAIRSLAGGA